MKIGIITYHFPYNCGAVLQCAALQTYLEKSGHNVNVINYRPWYHQNRYTPMKNPFYWAKRCMMKKNADDMILRRCFRGANGFLRTVYSWRRYSSVLPKHKKFESFIKEYLHETRVYRSLKQLQMSPPSCDAYISGSDQLWNPHLTNGELDPAYCLKFGEANTVRISYAISPNFKDIKNPTELFGNLLDDFDAISLRENDYIKDISKAYGKGNVQICIDPVFLLKAVEYENLICKNPLEKEPFILTYTMPDETQHKVYNAAKILSKKENIKVIDVSGNPSKVNRKIEDNRICGPDEFLWYMKNAKYVITNSFHGTAFSVVFQKEFVSIPHSKTGNRVRKLLDSVMLSSRWTNTGTSAVKIVTNKIDYEKPVQHLDKIRNISFKYLQDNLSLKN